MIVLDNVSCGYHKKEVLSGVSIAIKKGFITCLLGKNGVGKTTLFKTILGLLPSIKGNITYEGKTKESMSCKTFASLFSYVPQVSNTLFPFLVKDVVLMGQYIHSSGFTGAPGRRNVDIAMSCIEALGITELANRNFAKLSGGEMQMVLIARAMAQQPKYIAMDEPTANLDMGNKIRVLKTVKLLKKAGYGIIMNTHSPQQALQYADEVVLLKNGKVTLSGSAYTVLKEEIISDLYNVPVEIIDAQTSGGNTMKILIHS